jgi:superfamily II DNA or RNA helicase
LQDLLITVGDCVRVRRERWRVASVRSYENCRLLGLDGIGARNRNRRRGVLLPFERVEPIRALRRQRMVGSRRWQRECRRAVAASGGADALRAAQTARIDLLPHQLEPALALVRGEASRVLIADDVGLGKTIQAGLIAAELLRRGAIQRVLVLTPAGLREQWLGEMSDRFDLAFVLADTPALQRRRAVIHPGANPWATLPLVIASLDYIKRPEVLPAVERCRWDLVIVDEAHGVITAADRHAAVSRLAARAPYVLLLTATPHNGDTTAFGALRAIGGHDDALHVFRRTREDVGIPLNRRVHRLLVRPTAAEQQMHARLEAFSDAVLADHAERRTDVWLALSTLHKRALSSAFALHQTVERRLRSLAAVAPMFEQQMALPLDPDAGEHDEEDSSPRWTCPPLRDPGAERAHLTAIAAAARAALDVQAKLHALGRMIRRLREPVVVFTEYRDTLLHLRDRIAPDAAVVHGGMSRLERQTALGLFNEGKRTVLLATDAAGEGLNLHRTCRVVINLELPWNPMRLEQRIGRVDRIGQQRRVHAVHLIAADTREPELFARLDRRLARARQEIGVPDPLGTGHPPPRSDEGVPSLRIDATVEHRRLSEARRLTGGLDPGDLIVAGSAALVAVAPRRLRVRIAPQALALVALAVGDADGRPVAQIVKGVLLSLHRRLRHPSSADVRQLLDELAVRLSQGPRFDDDGWVGEAAVLHAAFWKCRIDRERAIGRLVAAQSELPRQPGLFSQHQPGNPNETSSTATGAEDLLAYLHVAEGSHSLQSLAPVVMSLLLP